MLRLVAELPVPGDDLRRRWSWTALRFFLKGQPQHVYRLYELMFNDTLGVAVVGGGQATAAPIVLGRRSALRPVGFERDEGMLPYPARSFLGYRLLTEFFAFPQKFLFFDLAGLDRRDAAPARAISWRSIFYLNRGDPRPGAERHGGHLPARLHADRQPVRAAAPSRSR